VVDLQARKGGSAQGGNAKRLQQHQAKHHTLREAAHREATQTAASTTGSTTHILTRGEGTAEDKAWQTMDHPTNPLKGQDEGHQN